MVFSLEICYLTFYIFFDIIIKENGMTSELIENIDKIHTTELGIERIKQNLDFQINGVENIIDWCKVEIGRAGKIERKGKNWYVYTDKAVLTVNAHSYTIITAKLKK